MEMDNLTRRLSDASEDSLRKLAQATRQLAGMHGRQLPKREEGMLHGLYIYENEAPYITLPAGSAAVKSAIGADLQSIGGGELEISTSNQAYVVDGDRSHPHIEYQPNTCHFSIVRAGLGTLSVSETLWIEEYDSRYVGNQEIRAGRSSHDYPASDKDPQDGSTVPSSLSQYECDVLSHVIATLRTRLS